MKKSPKTFTHLVQNDRDRMDILIKQGMYQKDIAKVLGKDPSTISREKNRHLKNNGTYDATNAEYKARVSRSNAKYQGMKIEQNPSLKQKIITELKAGASPDEIAGSMGGIGKDAIYKWLYSPFGQKYTKYLCTKRHTKKKYKPKTERVMIPNRKDISEMPTHGINAQGDTMLSPKKAQTSVCASVVVLESSKLLAGSILESLKPENMVHSIKEIHKQILFDHMLMDNGIENKYHEQFGVDTYFCKPYSPWQKGLVEGSIGLIRRWVYAKGTDLSKVSNEEFQKTLNFLNHKKRKSLGYKSAYEKAYEENIISFIPGRIAFEGRI
jgi:transposase, IS30 family